MTVSAVSVADPTRSASANVSITAPSGSGGGGGGGGRLDGLSLLMMLVALGRAGLGRYSSRSAAEMMENEASPEE